MIFGRSKTSLPDAESALPGRPTRPFSVGTTHLVLGTPIETDAPEGFETVVIGLGCFWGEEQTFWQLPGVWSTSVGYAGGITPNPTYEEVCSGRTGHAEVVRIIFDPSKLTFADLLKEFWENHDPTQGMGQGNDRGTQYRSIILTTTPEQQAELAALSREEKIQQPAAAEASRAHYPEKVSARGLGEITTSILPLGDYYYAEDYHQQYLVKNPGGYCPLHATGIKYD